jgi:tetratricopeptide (TPR) repeat protein
MKLGEKDKALILARRAVEAGPDTRNEQLTHFWSRQLGELLLEHGEATEAIPLLKQALQTTQIEGYLKDTRAKLEEAKKKAGVKD